MTNLKAYLDVFSKSFNPNKIDGTRIIDTKSTLALDYYTQIDSHNMSINMVVMFISDDQVFQTWGCQERIDEKDFLSYYLKTKNKIKDLDFQIKDKKRDTAKLIFAGLN